SVFVVGALCFEVMFWTPRALGAPDGAIVAAYLGVVWGYALTLRAPNAQPVQPWVAINLAVLYGFHLTVLLALWMGGTLADPTAKLAIVLSAATGLTLLAFAMPLRRSASVRTGS
ncbi:MAG: hypothetical protein AAFS10_24280, partial [Myxococcota bacterium]